MESWTPWDARLRLLQICAALTPHQDAINSQLHFVGFRGEEYHSAVKVWGKPDFVHIGHDNRMRRETASYDTIVFANGCETERKWHSYPDTIDCAVPSNDRQ